MDIKQARQIQGEKVFAETEDMGYDKTFICIGACGMYDDRAFSGMWKQ